jgi:hypothetical protein
MSRSIMTPWAANQPTARLRNAVTVSLRSSSMTST